MKQREYAISKQAGIDRADYTLEWYKKISPLELYLHSTDLCVKKKGSNYFKDVGSSTDTYKQEVVYFKTQKEFYPSHYCEKEAYCKGFIWENTDSNLELWTIHLGGNDDYSVSLDIIGKDEAQKEWERLKGLDVITDSTVEHYYFSN